MSLFSEENRFNSILIHIYKLSNISLEIAFSTVWRIAAPCCGASPECACIRLAYICYACRNADTWSVACRRTPAGSAGSCRRKYGRPGHTWDRGSHAGSRRLGVWACDGNSAQRRDTSAGRSAWSLEAQIETGI